MNTILLTVLALLSVSVCVSAESWSPQILKVDPERVDEEIADLENQGVRVLRHRDNLVLAYVPVRTSEGVAPVRLSNGIRRGMPMRRMIPALNKARAWYGADRIQHGTGLPQPYTGKGVVVGFCDIGFDPMHINFLDASGNSRVKRMVAYRETEGTRTVLEGDDAYREFRTDDETHLHATHVAGILAGSYAEHNYQGVATGADIVATVSMASDVGLLAGAEDIIEYAKEVGKPAVINMSMACYVGPRDGTSLFCQYLDKLGEEAIICLSAGNEGYSLVNVSTTYTEEKRMSGALCYSSDWMQFDMNGVMEVWATDSSPIRLRITGKDEENIKADLFALDWVDSSRPFYKEFHAEDYPEMAKYFTGTIYMEGGVSEENGRSYITVYLDTHTEERRSEIYGWARYILAVEVSGDPGTHTDLCCDRQYIWFRSHPDSDPVMHTLSLSDLVTGKNSISVGMYISRIDVTQLDGNPGWYGDYQVVGEIERTSSYGKTFDGRVIPLTVGPGTSLISSYNTWYIENKSEDPRTYTVDMVEGPDGRKYYWGQDSGTSMSSPYVAGYIATWLEANPDLTLDQVRDIILKTNDTSHGSNPRNGHGWFRPYDGLLEVLARSGVDNLHASQLQPRIEIAGDFLNVYNPGCNRIALSFINSDGTRIQDAATVSESFAAVPLPQVKGVCIAVITSPMHEPVSLKFMK